MLINTGHYWKYLCFIDEKWQMPSMRPKEVNKDGAVEHD